MKKEKILAFSLISLFFFAAVVLGGVFYYSDFYFPEKFREQVCSSFSPGEEVSAKELISYFKTQNVEANQIFVRAKAGSELLPISSSWASMMIDQADRGSGIRVVSVLGLMKKTQCEVVLDQNRIQEIQGAQNPQESGSESKNF